MLYKVTFSLPIPVEMVEATDWRVRDGFAEFVTMTDGETVVGPAFNFEHVVSIRPADQVPTNLWATVPRKPMRRVIAKPSIIPVTLDGEPLTQIMVDTTVAQAEGMLPAFDIPEEPF